MEELKRVSKGTLEVLRLNSRQDKRRFLIQNLQLALFHTLLPFNEFRWVFAAEFKRSGREIVNMPLSVVKVMNENRCPSGSPHGCPVWKGAHLPVQCRYFLTYLSACLLTCLLTYLRTYLLRYLLTYVLTYLGTYLLTYLLT